MISRRCGVGEWLVHGVHCVKSARTAAAFAAVFAAIMDGAIELGPIARRGATAVWRDFHEDARDVVRALAKTEAFEQSRRERKKIEMCFAHMKRIFKLDRLRLRGLSGVRDEVLLTATAQNLRRLVKLLGRPPPPFAAACPA